MIYITASAILPQWFSTRRSLAVGIAASGAGIGGLFYNLLAGYLVQSMGVPWTYRVMAILTFLINGICSILLKDRNRFVKPVQGTFSYRELGHAEVLLLISWGVSAGKSPHLQSWTCSRGCVAQHPCFISLLYALI